MAVVCVIGLIACIAILIVLWNKIIRQNEEIGALRREVQNISNYLQRVTAPHNNNNNTSHAANRTTSSGYAQPMSAPIQQAPIQQAPIQQAPIQQAPIQQAPIQQAPIQQAPVQRGPIPQAPIQQAPVQRGPIPQAPVQQVRAGNSTNSYQIPAYKMPIAYSTHTAADAVPPKPDNDKAQALESWLGRYVLGIAASILVFVGLVFLGTLVYNQVTDIMKIIAMYFISAVVTGIGIVLTVKKRNIFTEILVGCGGGSFFISILLTHIYFNKISDIAAFSLLLLWMAAILYISKVINSTLLSIVAHIGMIVSICFAFGMGLTDQKLPLLLIYQAAAIAVILLGSIFCCKKTYHFGVFISYFLTIIASCFMWSRFTANPYHTGSFPFATTLPAAAIAAAFAAQFLCASFLSYMLSVSTNRMKHRSYQMVIHIANKALWLAALIMNVYYVTYRLAACVTADSEFMMTADCRLSAVFAAVMICIAILIVHAALTLLLSLKYNFSRNLETYSVLFLGGVASVLLINLWGFQFGVNAAVPRITYLIVISLLLLLAMRISKNKAYAIGANIFLAADALFMLFDGYRNLTNSGTIALSIGYMILYIFILGAQWLLQGDEIKAKYSVPFRLISFILVEASLISILLYSPFKYRDVILLLILTALNTMLYIFRYDRNTEKNSALPTVMFINELVLIAFDAGFIAFSYKNETTTLLCLLLAVFAFGFSFVRIKDVFDGSNNTAVGVLTAIKLTVLMIATIYGITSWFDQVYCFSIICMLTALAFIIFGFAAHLKFLRIYGLVLALICVLKLVTFDVTNLNTPLRVVAFIGGGVICFIISAIYNYTEKKLCQENTQEKPEEK